MLQRYVKTSNSPELCEEVLPWRLSDIDDVDNDVDDNIDDEGNTGDETSFVTDPLNDSDGKEVIIEYGAVSNSDSAFDTLFTGGNDK